MIFDNHDVEKIIKIAAAIFNESSHKNFYVSFFGKKKEMTVCFTILIS